MIKYFRSSNDSNGRSSSPALCEVRIGLLASSQAEMGLLENKDNDLLPENSVMSCFQAPISGVLLDSQSVR